jgi:hypothetical protein
MTTMDEGVAQIHQSDIVYLHGQSLKDTSHIRLASNARVIYLQQNGMLRCSGR